MRPQGTRMPDRRDEHEQLAETAADQELERTIRLATLLAGRVVEPHKEPSWTKWMVSLAGLLVVAAIGGVVGMYGKLSQIEANQINQSGQISRLQNQVDELTRELRK